MIYLCAINDWNRISNTELQRFIPLLSVDRKQKVNKFQFSKDKKVCILSEMLLRYMLGNFLHVSIDEIVYEYNIYGKPFLKNYSEIYFNISHSGYWILCGISDSPIGIDVEGDTKIAKRFFLNEEYTHIKCEKNGNRNDLFFKYWTLKESYIKCVGKGLYIPLDSFGFNFDYDEILMIKKGVIDENYKFVSKKLDHKYHMSVCVEKGQCTNDIQIITLDELLNELKRIK